MNDNHALTPPPVKPPNAIPPKIPASGSQSRNLSPGVQQFHPLCREPCRELRRENRVNEQESARAEAGGTCPYGAGGTCPYEGPDTMRFDKVRDKGGGRDLSPRGGPAGPVPKGGAAGTCP